jgi:protein involved in polysaccharide export with SLBB domain
VLTVDLSKGIDSTPAGTLPELRPHDTVIVPTASVVLPSGEAFQVLGSVHAPGSYRLSAARTVVEALAASGGPLPEGDLSSIHLTRTTSEGVVSYRLDMRQHFEHGKPSLDVALQAGDAILVPEGHANGSWILDTATRLLPLVTLVTSIAVLTK